jgi:hypothetical protein
MVAVAEDLSLYFLDHIKEFFLLQTALGEHKWPM